MKNKLFVANLSWSISEEHLQRLFSQTAPVVSVRIPVYKGTDRRKGFAFVEMADEAGAQAIINQYHEKPIDGRPVVVVFQDEPQQPAAPKPSTKLFVRNLSSEVLEEDIFQLFNQAGPIASMNVPKDRDGNLKGYAFVEMEKLDQAQSAVERFDGRELRGQAIKVGFQDPNRGGGEDRGPRHHGDRSRGGYGDRGSRGSNYDFSSFKPKPAMPKDTDVSD